MGRAYFSEMALVMSTVGAMVPTGSPLDTRFSRASMEQRTPFLVGNFWYASRHTATGRFWDRGTPSSRWARAAALAFFSSSATSAACSGGSWAASSMPETESTPMAALGNSSQKEGSAINFFNAGSSFKMI